MNNQFTIATVYSCNVCHEQHGTTEAATQCYERCVFSRAVEKFFVKGWVPPNLSGFRNWNAGDRAELLRLFSRVQKEIQQQEAEYSDDPLKGYTPPFKGCHDYSWNWHVEDAKGNVVDTVQIAKVLNRLY